MDELNLVLSGWFCCGKGYGMNVRCVGLFVVVLVASIAVGTTAFALDCAPPGIASDTVACEHFWEGENLPECLRVEALHERIQEGGKGSRWSNCEYRARFINDYCSVSYVASFECVGAGKCPESVVLKDGWETDVDFGSDVYGEEGQITVTIRPGDEVGEDVLDAEDGVIGGVFMGGYSGEVTYHPESGCEVGFWEGCQVASKERPVGGFVGFAVMVLGLVGVVWRRRVVG